MNRPHKTKAWLAVLCLTPAAGRGQDAPPDAVIERWEQSWSFGADGSQVYHELRQVRLNHERAYGEFADPRIAFDANGDKVEVLVARTRLPDGRTLDVPSYSRNEVSPRDAAGWPAFASIRNLVLTYSGIEPGCTVELEYQIRSRPGSHPWPALDLRLDHRFPIKRRQIKVELADGLEAVAALSNPPRDMRPADARPTTTFKGSSTWSFGNVPAHDDEPASPPWQERAPRLALSTTTTVDAWVTQNVRRVESATDTSELITRLAAEWTKGAATPSDKLRALQEKLAATFNFVDFESSRHPAGLRTASQVLSGNYGLPREAASVLAALAAAAGVAVRPGLLVADAVWQETVPQDGLLVDVVLLLEVSGGREVWSARHGRVERNPRWDGHTVLSLLDNRVERTAIAAWSDAYESPCEVTGTIVLAADGKYSGKLNVRLAGLFLSPDALRSRDAQRERLGRIVSRVLEKATVGEFTVTNLSPAGFSATVEVKSSGAVDSLDGGHRLTIAGELPFMSEVSAPWALSSRKQPLRIEGPFDERVDVWIEWPAEWKLDTRPVELQPAEGEWGRVAQQVTIDGHRLRLSRQVQITIRDLAPEAFQTVRKAVNLVRSDPARTLLLRP